MDWLKVEDKAPPEFEDVLLWTGWSITGYRVGISFYSEDGVNPIFQVTHWMPLPEPPKE
jgi:hypothetical protein